GASTATMDNCGNQPSSTRSPSNNPTSTGVSSGASGRAKAASTPDWTVATSPGCSRRISMGQPDRASGGAGSFLLVQVEVRAHPVFGRDRNVVEVLELRIRSLALSAQASRDVLGIANGPQGVHSGDLLELAARVP